ncbi:MAG: ROK family protein [Thermoprotei archaeon]
MKLNLIIFGFESTLVMLLKIVVAVDVGATKTRVALFDSASMSLVSKAVVSTPQEGGREIVAETIVSVFNELVKEVREWEVTAVGVGSIGPLDIREGRVINSPNTRLRSFDLREPLHRYFRVPTYVVNDCVAAVYAEYMLGVGQGKKNIVYVTLSSGIGAGVIVDGHLLLGKDGNAHEVGHIVVSYDSDIKCGCGGVGHWEGLASGNNLWRLIKKLRSRWSRSSELYEISGVEEVSAARLFEYWKKGDEFASYVVRELAKINAAGIASVINVYDPEVISFGGSIILNNPEFLKIIHDFVKDYVINRVPEFTITRFGDDVVVYGAAYIALKPPKELTEI